MKLSVRVPREMLRFVKNNDSPFRTKSDFVNKAIDYYTQHLNTLRTFEGRLHTKSAMAFSESRLHWKLKVLGWSLLVELGCRTLDYELPLILEGKQVRPDVYGETPKGERIAVECFVSSIDAEKLRLLRKHLEKVIVLTPNDLIEHYEDTIHWYQETLKNISKQFRIPIIRTKPTAQTSVEFIETDEHVGNEILPFDAIKQELLKGNLAMIKDIKAETLSALHGKLREALKHEIKGKFKIYDKMVYDKGEAARILELKRYP